MNEALRLSRAELTALAEEIFSSPVEQGLVGNFYIEKKWDDMWHYYFCPVIFLDFGLDGYDFVRHLDNEDIDIVNELLKEWQG